MNLLDSTPNQPSKFKTNDYDDCRETYNSSNQRRFKTSMLKLRLCDYSDAYIFTSRTITGAGADDAAKR